MKVDKIFNKKGAAIELAIATLLVVFGLCMILVTVTELLAYNSKLSVTAATSRKNLSYIAEDFVTAHRTNAVFDTNRYSEGEYIPVEYALVDTNGWLLVLYSGNMGIAKLGVEITANGTDCHIVRWTYADDVVKQNYTLDDTTKTALHGAQG